MTKKITLLNFPTEIKANWGCKASSDGLYKAIKTNFPDSECRCHPIHFRLPDLDIPRDPEMFDSFIKTLAARKWEEYPDIEWSDIVILNGEGSIHEFENERINDIIYLKLLNIYAAKRLFGNQTMIVNHTLDFMSPAFERIVRTVYPTCDYISAREALSLKKLKELNIPATLTADTAFLCPTEKSDDTPIPIDLTLPEKYYVFFIAQLTEISPQHLKDLCEAIYNEYSLPVVFFILSKGETNAVSALKSSSIPSLVVEDLIDPSAIVQTLKSASFCLSGRFHATIFSALANTPFIGFRSNTYKIAGLIESMKYPLPELILEETPISKILETIRELMKNRDSLKSNINKQVKLAKELALTTNVKLP